MQTFLEFIKVRSSLFMEETPPPPAAGAAPPGGGTPPEAAPSGGGAPPPAMGGGGAPTGPVQKPVATKIAAKNVWDLIEKKYGDGKSKK
jgi:hypothetical protein